MKPICSLLLSLFMVAFYAQEQGSAISYYTTGLEHYNHQNIKIQLLNTLRQLS